MAIVKKIRRFFSLVGKLPSLPGRVRRFNAVIQDLCNQTVRLNYELEALKCSLQVDPELLDDFEEWKASTPIPSEPLVSVCVATYNRPHLLATRCLRSICEQSYRKLQIVVVGDGSSIETRQAVEKIGDPRIDFYNLPQRGHYPQNAHRRWMVAGTPAINEALRRARGDYITHLDDDDEYLPGRIESLVAFAQQTKADFIWHPFWYDSDQGWIVLACELMMCGSVTTSSVFYRSWFKKIEWDLGAHRLLEPGDWNRFRRFKYFEPLMARYPEPLLRHYRERMAAAG